MAATDTPKTEQNSNFWPALLLAILILLLGALGFYLLEKKLAAPALNDTSRLGDLRPESVGKSGNSGGNVNGSGGKDLKSIIQKDQQLVVQVQVQNAAGSSLGSGFLFDDAGDVVTNEHVVGNATNVTVKMADSTLDAGVVIGKDANADIALVRVPKLAGQKPMPIARMAAGDVGDSVVAFGSPLGLDYTVTTGIISGLHRNLTIEGTNYQNLIQMSAPIAPGNSGGPLVLQKTGEVIGVNSVGSSQGNIGFSIPITQVLPLLDLWAKHPASPNSASAGGSTSANGGDTSTVKPPFGPGPAVPPGDATTEPTTPHQAQGSSFTDAAESLVKHYYDSINAGDYVTAYSLLGSSWQQQTSFDTFRGGYRNTQSVTIQNIAAIPNGDNRVDVTAIIIAQEQTSDGNAQTSQYKVSYQVGYENSQLRLLNGTAEKI